MKVVIACLLLIVVAIQASQLNRNLANIRRSIISDQEKEGTVLSKSEIRRAGQGVLTTQTTQEKGRSDLQDNQWNSDDEGGTSVALSNLNSIESESNDAAEREEAQESRKKMGEEQRQKDEAELRRETRAAHHRRHHKQLSRDELEKDKEEQIKHQVEADARELKESQHKRDIRETRSEQQNKKFKEQTEKRITHASAENTQKQEKINAEMKKKRERDEEEHTASIRRPAWTLQKNQVLKGADLPFSGAYTYMFFVRPHQAISNWGNIIHKGQDNVNRNPAVWFYPGSTRLHVRSGTNPSPNWSNGGDNGCDPAVNLPINQWTHFAMIHDSWGIKVYLNGQSACNAKIGAPVQNTGPLYGSDPWHDVAQAELADLRYYSKAVSPAAIERAIQERAGL